MRTLVLCLVAALLLLAPQAAARPSPQLYAAVIKDIEVGNEYACVRISDEEPYVERHFEECPIFIDILTVLP